MFIQYCFCYPDVFHIPWQPLAFGNYWWRSPQGRHFEDFCQIMGSVSWKSRWVLQQHRAHSFQEFKDGLYVGIMISHRRLQTRVCFQMKNILLNFSHTCKSIAAACFKDGALIDRLMKDFTLPQLTVERLTQPRLSYMIEVTISNVLILFKRR